MKLKNNVYYNYAFLIVILQINGAILLIWTANGILLIQPVQNMVMMVLWQ